MELKLLGMFGVNMGAGIEDDLEHISLELDNSCALAAVYTTRIRSFYVVQTLSKIVVGRKWSLEEPAFLFGTCSCELPTSSQKNKSSSRKNKS